MLELRNLRKTYRNSKNESFPIIDIDNFAAASGKQIAISGESGSGKSTLLGMISGILMPDHGEIIIDGTDIVKISEGKKDHFRAKNIGYIFQTFNLLQSFTVLENVMLGMMFAGKVDKSKAVSTLEKVGLGKRINNKPSELSVGEQQRTAIARAIVNSPKLLLADEPTANLDNKNGLLAIDLIKELCLANNITLVMVTHQKEVMDRFDNVMKMENINKKKVSV
ncbi:ABC transporter ATP-binding protein [soil metagenome]